MALPDHPIDQRKQAIRQQALGLRRAQTDKQAVSQQIIDRLHLLQAYQAATVVMYYVDVRDEVRTRQTLPAALSAGKQIVVPYCVEGQLQLFHLESIDELEAGAYKILEPRGLLRDRADKRLAAEQLDLVIVPGVAFDRNGGRIGHGKGYYDKLLRHVRRQTMLVGLAYECQIVAEVPLEQHDIGMDFVVTEAAVYHGRRQADLASITAG